MQYLNYIKWILIIIAVGVVVWFYKDWEQKGYEADRLAENNRQKEIVDSLKVAFYVYDKKQMEKYVKQNIDFSNILKENNIKLNRVTSVMNHLLKYRDTTIVTTDMSGVLKAIGENKPFVKQFTDSSACLVLKGNLQYVPGEYPGIIPLSLNITDRQFTGETTVIGFWQRRQWKVPLLGIKTRFLGKKEATVNVTDKCGESQIINIELKKS